MQLSIKVLTIKLENYSAKAVMYFRYKQKKKVNEKSACYSLNLCYNTFH